MYYTKIEKMKELINTLNKASDLYYNGKDSFLTDKEFDNKLNELQQLEKELNIILSNSPTINVGASVLKGVNTIKIKDKPMLSLDKVHSAKEIETFAKGEDLIASIKCDGLSVRLIYQDTKMVSANTRGNGYEGQDITEHIKYFTNVPLTIAKMGKYIVDGEAIIFDKDFEIINKNGEYKNSRNLASGSLALLDMSIVKTRRLSFIAWDIIEGGDKEFYHYNLEDVEALGFTTVPALALDCTKITEEEINEINNNLLNEAKEKGIPNDGVVWKINNLAAGDKRGKTEHHFLNAVAWKPKDTEYETKLKYITYDVSRNGILTPVAVFEPVEIDGSTVERASLHNMSVMEDVLGKTPYCGEHIWVYKANQIIPQISRANKQDYGDIISHGGVTTGLGGDYGVLCPICGGLTEIRTSDAGVDVLYCTNDNCEGKLAQRIDHYCGKKGLDIKGLSRKTIEKLIDWGWINELRDIYELDGYRAEWISKTGFGESSVGKILSAIDASKKECVLSAFISALGIPLVGRTVAKEIVKYYDTWEEFRVAVGGDWTEFEGFGPEMSKAINNFDYTEADKIAELLTFSETPVEEVQSETAAGLTFCVTGKLKTYRNRDELKSYIESIGGKVVSSMSSKVQYLINNDATSTSAKNTAAKKAGIPILTEEDFISKFGSDQG